MKTKSLTIGVLIVLILGGGVWWLVHKSGTSTSVPPAVSQVVTAPAGQLVAGFPQALIAFNNPVITSSKSYTETDQSGGTSQVFVASYTVNYSTADVRNSYLRYLNTFSYKISFLSSTSSQPQTILADKGADHLSLFIKSKGEKMSEIFVILKSLK